MSADPYDISISLSADYIVSQANITNKPPVQDGGTPNIIDLDACVYQNVSDSVHDGLKESGAQAGLPPQFVNITAQHEDPHLEQFLYTLNKDRPSETTLRKHMTANYESYFRIPLFNKDSQNVDANGTPTYGHRASAIESMLDHIGVSSPNVFLSYDFGFPEVKYDIGFSKTRQFYVGYRPCQENDAAGKPTLSSSNANGFGLLSTQVPVEFIWTNRQIEPFFTYLPGYSEEFNINYGANTPPSENYALSRFDMYIGWDRSDQAVTGDKNEADLLKSSTIFHDPYTGELLPSNSDWTSKSGKDQKQYQKFSNELFSIQNKSPIELLSPKPIITGHNLQTSHFELLHALAKNSGDKLTAITYPNSYTPEMLASVMWINEIQPSNIGITNPTTDENGTTIDLGDRPLYIQHIGRILLDKPALAGEIAEQIDGLLRTPEYLNNLTAALNNPISSNHDVRDLITNLTNFDEIIKRESLRRKPRLFKKLKNKSEPIYDQNNYTYMWLNDYVFVYVTHDRLAAACALERLVDIVVLESPRQGEKSVFSLFVRKNTKNPEVMLQKNIENMRQKITDLAAATEVSQIPQVPQVLSVFGITVLDQPYQTLTEITSMFEQMQTYISTNHSVVVGFNENTNEVGNDVTLKKNIVNGLIRNVFQQIATSYDKLFQSFKSLLGISPKSDIDTDILNATIAVHINNVVTTFVVPLRESFSRLDQVDLPYHAAKTYFEETNTLFYKAKEYLQIYTAFQELSDKIALLSRLQGTSLENYDSLLNILSGSTDAHAKLLTQTTKDQIASLGPSKYITENAGEARSGRTPKDWFSYSKDALKRVVSGDLPNSFGLTKLFLKLIPMMNQSHVTAIFTYFKRFAIANTSENTNSKLDFKIVINCLKAILPESVFTGDDNVVTKNILAKLTEYDELFTLIVEEENTMLKQLEKAGKLVTKCLSKKKQLLERTKEAEIADKIKTAVTNLIPQQSLMSTMFGIGRRGGGRKTAHKYKSRKSIKTTCKNRKSGGENVVPITKGETNVKLRIEFFYRCITMYILYLTNVMELYSNLLKSIRLRQEIAALVTKLTSIVSNISHIRDSLIVAVDRLASDTGRTLIALFGPSSANLTIKDSVEYFPKQVDASVSEPNKDQISVLLEDSFNLHLVNVGTYISNMELIPDDSVDLSSLQDVLDELIEIVDMSHSGQIEYIFVNDNDSSNGTSASIDAMFADSVSINPLSFNFGYNNALTVLLKYNQTYLNAQDVNAVRQRFQSHGDNIYDYSIIDTLIKADLIATGKFDVNPIRLTGSSIVIFQQQVHELQNGRIVEIIKETPEYVDNSSLLIEDADEQSAIDNFEDEVSEEVIDPYVADNNHYEQFEDLEEKNNYSDSDMSGDLLAHSDDEYDDMVEPVAKKKHRGLKNNKQTFRLEKERPIYYNNDEHYTLDNYSLPVSGIQQAPQTKRPRGIQQAPQTKRPRGMDQFTHRRQLAISEPDVHRRRNGWYGGNKTRKRLNKIKSRKYTKKYQKTTKRLRKTRKNTKRPKYIKKNVTKRRR